MASETVSPDDLDPEAELTELEFSIFGYVSRPRAEVYEAVADPLVPGACDDHDPQALRVQRFVVRCGSAHRIAPVSSAIAGMSSSSCPAAPGAGNAAPERPPEGGVMRGLWRFGIPSAHAG